MAKKKKKNILGKFDLLSECSLEERVLDCGAISYYYGYFEIHYENNNASTRI